MMMDEMERGRAKPKQESGEEATAASPLSFVPSVIPMPPFVAPQTQQKGGIPKMRFLACSALILLIYFGIISVAPFLNLLGENNNLSRLLDFFSRWKDERANCTTPSRGL